MNQSNLELGGADALQPNEELCYSSFLDKIIKPNMMCVEIGTWKGLTASMLANRLKSMNGHLFVVDHWKGIDGTHEYARKTDVYQIFKNNMQILGLWDIVHPLVMDSMIASKIFKDGILDYVFIDGDHNYLPVKEDIIHWLPKLKPTGILAGHDYKREGIGHPTVKQACDEILGDKVKLMSEAERITLWWVDGNS